MAEVAFVSISHDRKKHGILGRGSIYFTAGLVGEAFGTEEKQ